MRVVAQHMSAHTVAQTCMALPALDPIFAFEIIKQWVF